MTIIISLCLLLLVAYLFDLTASMTKIPSVILLLVLGWLVRQVTVFFELEIPDLTSTLPILGTIGLILIVLEGSLELELNKSKIGLIKKSSLGAFVPLIGLAFSLAYAFHYYGGYSFKDCLTNAIPFCVISSAIAIPSVRNLSSSQKEFIIYESSLSDIFGVVFFNFIAFNTNFGLETFGYFCLEILIIIAISFVATILLSFLLNKIDHHIKFVPIILLVILIYEISKIFHLPALIFILVFGLSIGNLDELNHFKWAQRFRLDLLNKEVVKFKELMVHPVKSSWMDDITIKWVQSHGHKFSPLQDIERKRKEMSKLGDHVKVTMAELKARYNALLKMVDDAEDHLNAFLKKLDEYIWSWKNH